MLVSAFAFGGAPQRAISAVLGEAQPFVTPELLEEYRDVAPRLFADGKIAREQLESLVSGIAAFASATRLVKTRRRVVICRDPEDDMVLECCRAARAAVLITGDADTGRSKPSALSGGRGAAPKLRHYAPSGTS